MKSDPDGMLHQALNTEDFPMPDYQNEFTSGARGFLGRVTDQEHWRQVLSDSGVDRFALSGPAYLGSTMLFRAGDPEAARKLWSTILEPAFPGPVEPPASRVPGTRCGEGTADSLHDKKRYRCAIVYRRHVATVDSDQLADVYQRAAAQYALMANSTW
ncbi:DUF7373 family lipoprotein [Nocardia seriolae]|nr:hypothetical protein [Nocardia seriolae]APB01495.1 hypothetical protein NS506_07475 [Nocardia seriolae]MTJ61019.1 hypothetical protein [Nocardia seriolae]MTJ70519.1 hypothetical protein [Nocardia seriolae]MTJ90848.1 hypothetical protein [Nocardia seriolae]MTK34805.1 hypothetical protein [Nocardia seriolae]